MRTEKLWISDAVRRNLDADDLLTEYAEKKAITGKALQHMRLLTEETMGMAHQLLKNFDGEIWLEDAPGGYDIILEAEIRDGSGEKHGMAEDPEGFMAKVAEMLNCTYAFESAENMPEDLAGMLPDYMSYGIREDEKAPVWAGRWSLTSYRHSLLHRRRGSRKAEILLDELEKSIVGRLASEVTIGIVGRKIRLVITGRSEPEVTPV